jgi:hypothetical protein
MNLNGAPYYNSLAECINSQSIYEINIYKKNNKVENCLPVWTYTKFNNDYQKIGITDEKIMIRIVEI